MRRRRIVRVADAVAYEAAVSRPAEEFRRKVRISCQAFNVNRALWPRLLRLPALDLYKYVSHKLLRWLSIYPAGGCGVCACWPSWLARAGACVRLLLAVLAGCALVGVSRAGRWASCVRYCRPSSQPAWAVPLVAWRYVPDLEPAGVRTRDGTGTAAELGAHA